MSLSQHLTVTQAANRTFKLPSADGTSGQPLVTDGSGALSFANSGPTTAGGTMTIGFQDHTSGNVSSTTATGYYQRIGNMVWGAVDTGSVNTSGLQSGQILLLTGCFPITRDNNWQVVGSCYHYNVNLTKIQVVPPFIHKRILVK